MCTAGPGKGRVRIQGSWDPGDIGQSSLLCAMQPLLVALPTHAALEQPPLLKPQMWAYHKLYAREKEMSQKYGQTVHVRRTMKVKIRECLMGSWGTTTQENAFGEGEGQSGERNHILGTHSTALGNGSE